MGMATQASQERLVSQVQAVIGANGEGLATFKGADRRKSTNQVHLVEIIGKSAAPKLTTVGSISRLPAP